jgi:hypothetical protein
MKKLLKSAAVVVALAFVFAACDQVAIGSAGDVPFDIAQLSAAKGVPVTPAVAVTPDQWQAFSPLPFANVKVDMVRGLATDGTFLVAAGSDGTYALATRYDTISGAWTIPVTLPGFTVNPGAAHFLNRYFLITGGTSNPTSLLAAYSEDGLKWDQTGYIGFGTKAGVYGYEEELYVVAGQNGQAAFAYDPGLPFITIPQTYTNWSGTGNTAYINAGAYGDGVYVFGGGSGRIAWTETILDPNGGIVEWTQVTGANNPFASTDFVNAIAYGNEIFVAVGNVANNDEGVIAYSTNSGQSWTKVTITTSLGANSGIYALAFGNGYFVASDNEGNFAYSTDGATWTDVTPAPPVFSPTSRVNATVYYDAANAFVVAGQDYNGVQVAISN